MASRLLQNQMKKARRLTNATLPMTPPATAIVDPFPSVLLAVLSEACCAGAATRLAAAEDDCTVGDEAVPRVVKGVAAAAAESESSTWLCARVGAPCTAETVAATAGVSDGADVVAAGSGATDDVERDAAGAGAGAGVKTGDKAVVLVSATLACDCGRATAAGKELEDETRAETWPREAEVVAATGASAGAGAFCWAAVVL